MKLNLASGEKRREGWINADISSDCKPDMIFDALKFPWQWKDGEFEEIYCSHFIEHIGEELIPFMEECYRVLEPGGIAHFEMPYYTSIRAWQDPTHKRPISELLFSYFNKEWLKLQGIGHYNIKTNFEIKEIRYHYPNGMKDLENEELNYMREHAWNTVSDFEVLLKALK